MYPTQLNIWSEQRLGWWETKIPVDKQEQLIHDRESQTVRFDFSGITAHFCMCMNDLCMC